MLKLRLGRFLRKRPSIYEHIRANLNDVGLREEGHWLPDEDELAFHPQIKFAPGASERLLAHETPAGSDDQLVAQVHAALVDLADRPGGRSRANARRAFRRADPRMHGDAVRERLRVSPPRDLDRLYVEARTIALEAGRREEVKFALVVLSRFRRDDDADLLRTFARHDEFTLYAAVALADIVEDPVSEWLELIRHVNGWGRIELVELLAREPRADACAFLLREGFRTPFGYSSTAAIVAERCDLAGALERERDEALVAAARDIVSTLAEDAWDEWPTHGMLDYEHGLAATERLLALMEPRELADYLSLDSLRTFAEDELDWCSKEPRQEREERRVSLGWTAEARKRVALRCRELLAAPVWRQLVETELAHDHEELPWKAVKVGKRLGMPVHAFLLRHLERHPQETGAWYQLVHDADAETMDEALLLASSLYEFDELAQGRATSSSGRGWCSTSPTGCSKRSSIILARAGR